jgi:hypothetical protein
MKTLLVKKLRPFFACNSLANKSFDHFNVSNWHHGHYRKVFVLAEARAASNDAFLSSSLWRLCADHSVREALLLFHVTYKARGII